MKRAAILLGVASLVIGGLAFGSGGVRAGELDEDEAGQDRKIEIVRGGGGSFLGVGIEDVDGGARGAKVTSVQPESAAEKAGVEDGDVITGFDGEAVRSARQLARLVRETPGGREVEITVQRGGATKTLAATLDEGSHRIHREFHMGDENVFVPDLEDFDVDIDVHEGLPHGVGPHVFRWHGDGEHDFTAGWWGGRPRLGVQIMDIGAQLSEYFELTADEAVLVSGVTADSPAAKAGIEVGDIVLEFDGQEIRDGGDLRSSVRKARGGEAVSMKVHRDGRPIDLQVTLPAAEKPKTIRRESGVSL